MKIGYLVVLLGLTACNHYSNRYLTCIPTSQCPEGICVDGTCQESHQASNEGLRSHSDCGDSSSSAYSVIYFAEGESDLDQSDREALDVFVGCLASSPDAQLKSTGNTDVHGTDAANSVLSKKRAEVVARYLAKSGVQSHRIKSVGQGSAVPADPANTESAWAKNRRTDVTIE